MKKCVECGKQFQPNKFTPYQIYCSRRCYRRVYHRKWSLKRSRRFKTERIRLVKTLGGKCVACGTNDIFVLTIDHVHNDGNKTKNGYSFIRKMLNNPEIARERLQVLCWNHNLMKSVFPQEFQRRFPYVPAK